MQIYVQVPAYCVRPSLSHAIIDTRPVWPVYESVRSSMEDESTVKGEVLPSELLGARQVPDGENARAVIGEERHG